MVPQVCLSSTFAIYESEDIAYVYGNVLILADSILFLVLIFTLLIMHSCQRYLLEQRAVIDVDSGKYLNEDGDIRSVSVEITEPYCFVSITISTDYTKILLWKHLDFLADHLSFRFFFS